jgi:hypothetical protein
MHAIDTEQSSANADIPDDPNPEPSQQDLYASNPYMYNYEEYGYIMYNQQHYF